MRRVFTFCAIWLCLFLPLLLLEFHVPIMHYSPSHLVNSDLFFCTEPQDVNCTLWKGQKKHISIHWLFSAHLEWDNWLRPPSVLHPKSQLHLNPVPTSQHLHLIIYNLLQIILKHSLHHSFIYIFPLPKHFKLYFKAMQNWDRYSFTVQHISLEIS